MMENCDCAICPALSIVLLYAPKYQGWLFKESFFELETSLYNFKISSILVRQPILFKKTQGWYSFSIMNIPDFPLNCTCFSLTENIFFHLPNNLECRIMVVQKQSSGGVL